MRRTKMKPGTAMVVSYLSGDARVDRRTSITTWAQTLGDASRMLMDKTATSTSAESASSGPSIVKRPILTSDWHPKKMKKKQTNELWIRRRASQQDKL